MLEPQKYYDIWTILKDWPKEIKADQYRTLLQKELSMRTVFDGLDLTIGVSPIDKKRKLLLSSLQVECIRSEFFAHYKYKLPLPSKAPAEFAIIEIKPLKNRKGFEEIAKATTKWNKTMVRNVNRLEAIRNASAEAQRYRKEETVTFIAVDCESWERNHDLILEVGYSVFETAKNTVSTQHIIIKEYLHLRNGKWVADNRDYFKHGTSLRLSKAQAAEHMTALFHSYDPVALVGHDVKGDIAYLKQLGVDLPLRLPVYDTRDLDGARCSDPSRQMGLSNLCFDLGLSPIMMHNAGNDAHWTMQSFIVLTEPSGPVKENLIRMSVDPETDPPRQSSRIPSIQPPPPAEIVLPARDPFSPEPQDKNVTLNGATSITRVVGKNDIPLEQFPTLAAAAKMPSKMHTPLDENGQRTGSWRNQWDEQPVDDWTIPEGPPLAERLSGKAKTFKPKSKPRNAGFRDAPKPIKPILSLRSRSNTPSEGPGLSVKTEEFGKVATPDPEPSVPVENSNMDDVFGDVDASTVDYNEINWLKESAFRNNEKVEDSSEDEESGRETKVRIIKLETGEDPYAEYDDDQFE